MTDSKRKKIFYLMAVVTFFMVAVYQYLTPNMSDDIYYGDVVAKADSVIDLFRQEYEHYMNHSGRNVAHIMLRFFLYSGNKLIFDVVAALVFTLQSILIYLNIDARRKYDLRMYGFVLAFLWLLDPTISNSVFWETGSCNYLFTGTIILGFVTFFRKHMRLGSANSAALCLKMFVLGLLAGWCNENTSGGAILFVLLLLLKAFLDNEKKLGFIKPWMVFALAGSMIGFAIMILSPGNFGRAEVTEEEHTGLLAVMARFLKIMLNLKDNYFLLIALFAGLLVFIAYMSADKRKFMEATGYMRLLGFVAFMTAFSLLAVPSSQLRTYYGASLFLMMAVLNGIAQVANTGFMSGSASDVPKGLSYTILQTLITSSIVIVGIYFAFIYLEEGANLARIKREFNERDAYLYELSQTDEVDAVVPMLRPQWENRFSMAYDSDIRKEWQYWINIFYSEHYGFDTVSGVDREEWTEY